MKASPLVLAAGLALAPLLALAQALPEQDRDAAAGIVPGVTRDQFIQNAQQRAAQHAAQEFDHIDFKHAGMLDQEEIAAWDARHHGHRGGPPGGPGEGPPPGPPGPPGEPPPQ
jgi:ferredoxin-NADP reductase